MTAIDNSNMHRVVIVGASHAGVNAAFNLRKEGYSGQITLVDSDFDLPYHKPPLSKTALSNAELTGARNDSADKHTYENPYLLKASSAYEKQAINLLLGKRVISLDRSTKTLLIAHAENSEVMSQQEPRQQESSHQDQSPANQVQVSHYEKVETLAYDQLILATGSRAFIPPINGIQHNPAVFTLRTLDDARAIQNFVGTKSVKKAVVIGGGYIGLETAASLVSMGISVTIIEREERVLARVTSPEMSAYFTQLHRANGVNIQTGLSVEAIKSSASTQEVQCQDGSVFSADLVIVGVGIRVNTELAEAANLECENGIKVNASMQTNDLSIFAIGDCSVFMLPKYNRQVRLESVQNALDQAKVAAKVIVGKTEEYNEVPWFWSDQYKVKLQIVGLFNGYDELVLRKEANQTDSLSLWYFKNGRLLAVDAINHAKAYVLASKALKNNLSINRTLLADEGQTLSAELLV